MGLRSNIKDRISTSRLNVILKHFKWWDNRNSELLQEWKEDNKEQSILDDYEFKLENRYSLDLAVDEVFKINRRINDMNPETSLHLIIGLIAEQALSHVLNKSLDSTLFKFRYFYWVDGK